MKIPPSKLLVVTFTLGLQIPLSAQTTWDAGGGADTSINLNTNWNNDVANSLNGTQGGTFGTAGSNATMNVDGYFSSLTFNRNDAAGFTINGPGILSVLASGSGSTSNFIVTDQANNGVVTINAPFRLNTDAGGTRLLVIENRERGTTGESLLITNGISSSNGTNAYGMRFAGAGSTRISGPITGTLTTNIQQASVSGQNMAGTVTIAGNQTLGSAQVNIAGTGSGTVASTAKFVMGNGTADVQSWGSSTVNQNATIEIRSTATTGAIALSNAASGGSSGGTLDVSGNLNATTLAIGGAANSGILKVSGNATFSGAITSGVTAGSKIVGGGASNGTLTLSSGTIGSAVAIGGAGANENNLALVKATTGNLTVNSANNTYSGGTTLVDGGGSGSFGIALGANNALGTGPLVIGTNATGGNGARLRMNGFNQTVSSLSSGATSNGRVIENFGASNSTLTVNGATTSTYAGALRDRSTANATATGNLGLVKSGNGTLVLSSGNQYTGTTEINGGVLEVATLANGGITKTVTTTAGNATVTMADTSGITNGMTFVAATLPTGFAVTTVDSGTDITINTTSGILTGSSTAHFGVASGIGLSTNAASNLVFGGGTLRYTGGNTTTDRNFTINPGQSANWDVANAATTLTLTGSASASTGGLQKLGNGTLILSGSHGYTGNTTVSTGTLLINGSTSASSAVSVASGATLGGNGTIGGATTINGILSPGNSPGLANFGSSLTLNSTATTLMEIGNTTTRGITFDGVDVGTILTYGGALSLNMTTTFGEGTYSWNLFDFASQAGNFTTVSLSNNYTGSLTNSGGGTWGLTSGNFTWSFTQSDGVLGLSVIPEPSTWAMLVGGLTSLVILRRRRRYGHEGLYADGSRR